jgi:biopolymer transport protein ExbD
VFLLLVFFLVATMMKKENKDINITPPESRSAERLVPDDDQLVIGIDDQGELFYEGRATTLHLLHQRLGEVAVMTPDRRVRLDADSTAPFERVVEVLNACQFRRLNNVGIRTYDQSYNRR